MDLLHGTRSSSSSNSRHGLLHYRRPLQRAAGIHLSRRSMTTARPGYQRNPNPQHPLFDPRRQSHLQVIHQPQMARSSLTRVKSAERGSRDVAISSVTYGFTQASGHSYAPSRAAGRNSFRYVVQNFRIVPHVVLMYTFTLESAQRWTYICVYIPGRSPTAANIQGVIRRLVIRVHLRVIEEHIQANVHINVKILSAKRRSPGELH